MTLALTALAFGGLLMVGMPLLLAGYLGKVTGDADGLHVWGPMIATLLGLTTMTVAGIFLFMTFRIDRGVKLKATEVARDEAKQAAIAFLADRDIQACLDRLLKRAEDAANDFDGSLRSKAERAESLVDGLRTQVEETDVEAVVREAVEVHFSPERVDAEIAEWLSTSARRALAVEELRHAIAAMTPEDAREFVEALMDALRDMQRSLGPEPTGGIGHRIRRWFRRRDA